MPNQSKAVRSALLVARRQRAGGGSLSDVMNSFSQAREAQFNRPASGNSGAALLAALQSQHPQLAIAEAPEQPRQSTSQGVGDLGAEIDEGAKWLSGTQDNDPAPVKGASQNKPIANNTAPSQPLTSQPASGGDLIERTKYGLAGVETPGQRDPYAATGPVLKSGDRAYGKYQVMGSNIPTWTKEATGVAMTPEQFRQSPEAQEATVNHQLGKILSANGNDPNQAASVWFTGRRIEKVSPDASDGYTTNSQYQKKFSGAFNSYPSQGSDTQQAQAKPAPTPTTAPAPSGFGQPASYAPTPDWNFKFDPNNTEDKSPSGPQAEADPLSNLYNKVAFSPDVQSGYGNPQAMFDPDTPQAKRGGYLHRASGGGTHYSAGDLQGEGLQGLINNAEGDEDLGKIVHSLNFHGALVPPSLRGVSPVSPESRGGYLRRADGGLMRRNHFDDGGSAGDSAATAAGVAAGFGGVGDANGAPAGVSTNSGVTGFAGVGEDGDTGFGSVGYNSPSVNTAGSGGGNTGFGGASSGSGGGANSSGVGVGANSAGAGAAAGNGSGGGGGTAAGGSSNGAGGAGVSGTQNGGNIGVTAQDIYAMLEAAGKQSQINFGGPGGPGSVQSLGVPPGALSGVNTATTPVSVSSLGPPGYSQSQVAAINAMMAARGGVGLGGGTSTGFGNNGFGGGSSSATVGGFGGNSNSTGAEGVSTAGIGGLGGGPAAVTAPSMEAQLGPAQQAMLAQMRSGVASPSGPPGSAPAAAPNAPSVNATNMMGVQGFNVAGPRSAAPAPSAAPQASGATSGRNPQAQNAVEHQNRGGYLQRAGGGSVAHIPTNELIEMALGRIRQRRNAANGGSQDLGLSFAALAPRSAGGNQAQYAYNLGLGGLGPAGDINPGSAQGQAFQSSQGPAAAAAPAPPNTPAIPGGAVGNHGGYGAVGTSGSPISGVPDASPVGGGYNNTLDQVLGTNNPSMDQIFGFTYPTPPAPKAQPQGPVSQDTINQLALMGNGAQQFASGGAIIMDAALNKARKAVKGNRTGRA